METQVGMVKTPMILHDKQLQMVHVAVGIHNQNSGGQAATRNSDLDSNPDSDSNSNPSSSSSSCSHSTAIVGNFRDFGVCQLMRCAKWNERWRPLSCGCSLEEKCCCPTAPKVHKWSGRNCRHKIQHMHANEMGWICDNEMDVCCSAHCMPCPVDELEVVDAH